jgi:hypothetical protein
MLLKNQALRWGNGLEKSHFPMDLGHGVDKKISMGSLAGDELVSADMKEVFLLVIAELDLRDYIRSLALG